jgi:hypothetical protein
MTERQRIPFYSLSLKDQALVHLDVVVGYIQSTMSLDLNDHCIGKSTDFIRRALEQSND